MFCSTCSTMLRPEKTPYGKWMRCPNDHPQPESKRRPKDTTIINHQQTHRIRVSDGINHLAVHDHSCSKCNHDKAEMLEIAPMYSDEDPLVKMRCGKCNHVDILDGKHT